MGYDLFKNAWVDISLFFSFSLWIPHYRNNHRIHWSTRSYGHLQVLGQAYHSHLSMGPPFFIRSPQMKNIILFVWILDILVMVSSYFSSWATINSMGVTAAYYSTWCRMGDIAAGGFAYTSDIVTTYPMDRTSLVSGSNSSPDLNQGAHHLWDYDLSCLIEYYSFSK